MREMRNHSDMKPCNLKTPKAIRHRKNLTNMRVNLTEREGIKASFNRRWERSEPHLGDGDKREQSSSLGGEREGIRAPPVQGSEAHLKGRGKGSAPPGVEEEQDQSPTCSGEREGMGRGKK